MPTLNQCKANIILGNVATELDRAMTLHGAMNSRHEAFAVILEELDEFWDEVKLNPAKMNQFERSAWKRRMREELIQTAAMITRAIIDLDLDPTDTSQAKDIYDRMEIHP